MVGPSLHHHIRYGRREVNVLYTTVMILITELIIGLVGAVLFEIASRKDEDDTHNKT